MRRPITNRRGIFSDARLRGRFQQWLGSQGTTPPARPGQDANRAQQGVNAAQGAQYHTATQSPRYTVGQRLQRAVRNRPNEQAGMPKPAAPALPPTVLPMRKT